MRQLFLLFVSVLSFAYAPHSFAQCIGSITLENQEDVDAFPVDYGCSVIQGNLIIEGGSNFNNYLTDLTPLAGITSIEGALQIRFNESLTSLDGLQNISTIGEYLWVSSNENLTNLDGLIGLSTIGGKLHITSNDSLTNLDGLIGVSTTGGIDIDENNNLTNLDGLQNINTVNGELTIGHNDNLTNLDGLSNINTLNGDLYIGHNDNLTNLDGLSNIPTVGGFIIVSGNESLINLDGLINISAISGRLSIGDNDNLTNLGGLININAVYGGLGITGNYNLTNLDGLQNINTVIGELRIGNNLDLTSLEELINISTVSGDLLIYNNTSLTNLEGLNNIPSIGGNLRIHHSDSLTSIDALNNISAIGGDLRIYRNDNLEDCCAVLPIAEVVEGDIIEIYENLPSCNSVEEIIESCIEYKIKAIAFFDENENNTLDSTEQVFQQAFNLNPSALYSFTNQSGSAYFYLEDFGEYELSLNNNNPLWEFSGTNNPIPISFSDIPFTDGIHYFPMSPVGEFVIQSIDLSSSITRCNQETNYWLTYTNEGTTTNNGYVELIPDDLVNFVSANPPADSTAGGKLYWFYENLYPTHSNQIHLVYQMPGVNEIGEPIDFEANIATNEGYSGRTAYLSSELICAYDPNDKLVSPFGYGDENYTLFGDTLEYTIRFQNTGNDTAFTVIIEDEISEYLNLNTFRPIASSHNLETKVDANTRLATFTFNDIYLADSFVNEPASHGFVKFQILGNDDLDENTIVENTGNIFFDFNPAIVTNTTSNQMVSVLPALPILTTNTDIIDFGEINLEELEENIQPQILFIENPGDFDLTIQNIAVEGTDFSAQIQSQTIVGQGSTMVLIYFYPNEAGTYQSQLTIQSDVGELTIDLTGSAVLETGLNNFETNAIDTKAARLFPNPNEGSFYLTATQAIQRYQIRNSLGSIVLEQSLPNTNVSKIDLQGQPKGIYFITVQTTYGMTTEKFLVQ